MSYESLALDTPLAFPPPMAELSPTPDSFEFWWKLLQFVFSLPPPAAFPKLPAVLSEEDLAALSRYIAAAEDMAQSALLGGHSSVTVTDLGESSEPEIESTFESSEVTRGFCVLFRQFHAPGEAASFLQMQRILRAANQAANDEHVDQRLAELRAWGKARGHLLGENLRVRVGQKLIEVGRWQAGDEFPGQSKDGMTPEQLISAYQYGDLIHWGDKRGVIAAVANDPFADAWQRLLFLEAAAGLTHLYLGFALLVRAALPE